MKKLWTILLLFSLTTAFAQTAENIIIITTDGLRWQEISKRPDSLTLKEPR